MNENVKKTICIIVSAFWTFFILPTLTGCQTSEQIKANPGNSSPGATKTTTKTDKTVTPSPTTTIITNSPSTLNSNTKTDIQTSPKQTNTENEIDISKKFKTKAELIKYYQDKGSKYLRNGDAEKAIEYFTRAIKLNPDNYEGYDLRSMAYYEDEEHEKGILDCNKAISIAREKGVFEKICPHQTLVRRGAHYMNLKKYKEAVRDFSMVIRYRPDFAFAYYDRGRCYFRMGDYESAQRDFQKSIKLDKENEFTGNCRKYLKEIKKMRN